MKNPESKIRQPHGRNMAQPDRGVDFGGGGIPWTSGPRNPGWQTL